MSNQLILAVDLGGTKTAVGCFRDAELIGTSSFTTPKLPKDFEILLESEIRVLLTRLDLNLEDIAAIGVGAAGYWDANCLLQQSINLPKYVREPIWTNISAALDKPVYLKSDVDLAVLGEAVCGQENKYKSVLYINLGTGIGAGLFKDGEIYSTDYSPALRLEYMVQADFSASTLSSRADQSNSQEQKRKENIAALSTTLVNLACIMVPQLIVLGGGKTKGENWDLVVRPAIDKALEYLEAYMVYPIKITKTKLENPTLYGAYILAISSLKQEASTSSK